MACRCRCPAGRLGLGGPRRAAARRTRRGPGRDPRARRRVPRLRLDRAPAPGPRRRGDRTLVSDRARRDGEADRRPRPHEGAEGGRRDRAGPHRVAAELDAGGAALERRPRATARTRPCQPSTRPPSRPCGRPTGRDRRGRGLQAELTGAGGAGGRLSTRTSPSTRPPPRGRARPSTSRAAAERERDEQIRRLIGEAPSRPRPCWPPRGRASHALTALPAPMSILARRWPPSRPDSAHCRSTTQGRCERGRRRRMRRPTAELATQ